MCAGNLTRKTDAVGDVTTMTYDSHGLVLTVTSPRRQREHDSHAYTTSFTYNDAGQIRPAQHGPAIDAVFRLRSAAT